MRLPLSLLLLLLLMPPSHSLPSSPPATSFIFTDLDGTIIHYPASPSDAPPSTSTLLLPLPPTSTGLVGYVSRKTVKLLHDLKYVHGVKIAIVTGARTTTALARLPVFSFNGTSAIDYVVAESGGRVFAVLEDGRVEEDEDWARKLEPSLLSLRKREADLTARGFVVDNSNYRTQFRLHRSKQPTPALVQAFDDLLASPDPPGLTQTTNLGHLDVYPSISGKAAAALHVLGKLEEEGERGEVYSCGDDENDIELALSPFVTSSFFPRLTSPLVKEAVDFGKERNTFTGKGREGGIMEDVEATEKMLEIITGDVERRRGVGERELAGEERRSEL